MEKFAASVLQRRGCRWQLGGDLVLSMGVMRPIFDRPIHYLEHWKSSVDSAGASQNVKRELRNDETGFCDCGYPSTMMNGI
jgi:hypothetical protein